MTDQNVPSTGLIFNSVAIRDRGEMLSLTDMWRAAGGEDARRPTDWLASADAQRFVSFLAETLNAGDSGIDLVRSTRGGRTPGTMAHWQVALAYAKYLSAEFHVWCNTVVRERMEGKPHPAAMVLDQDTRQVFGGIMKAVVNKAVAEMLPELVRSELAGRTHSLVHDQFTAGQVLDKANVPHIGRRGLVVKASNALRRYCLRVGHIPREATLGHTKAYLFPKDLAERWMAEEGRKAVAEHMIAQNTQGRLRLVQPSAASISRTASWARPGMAAFAIEADVHLVDVMSFDPTAGERYVVIDPATSTLVIRNGTDLAREAKQGKRAAWMPYHSGNYPAGTVEKCLAQVVGRVVATQERAAA